MVQTSSSACTYFLLSCILNHVFCFAPYNANFEDQMREKCMSRPGLSFFSRDKIRCISRRANIGFGCLGEPSTVGFQEEENESITAEERRMTLFSGAAKESEMMNTLLVTCTLTAGTCGNPQDFTQVSYKCYSLNRTPRTYAEAWNFCQQRGTVLLVLSEDRDIRDVLKYMTSKHPDIVAVWTGLHRNTVQSGWQVPPGYGNADYARWMPDSNFTNLPMATIVHTRSYDPMYGSYAGYMSPRHQYEKFPALCVKSVESNFANDVLVTLPFDPVITTTTAKITTSTRATVTTTTKSPVTTTAKTTVKTTTKAPGTTTTKKPVTTTTKKPVTTTTKKPVTTTTKAPVVTTAAPGLTLEELVSQNILGRQPMNNILYRSYNQGLIYHQYHRDFDRHCANSNAKERFVGFVVTPTMAGVQGRCPELFQLNMYQNRGSQAWTFFNVSNSNSNLDFVASFFCAPRRGYCGANFEMVEYLSKVGAGDKFIASFTAESQGTANNNFYQNQPNRRLCWIWRDAPSNISTQFNRARNQVLSAGNPIMRTHVTQQNTYSVSRTDQNNLISQGRQAKPDIGFIVTHQMWLDTFRQSCPELIPMGVHRRSGSVTTYFGHNPPYPADRIGGFYCAPRRGYCGADYLLRQRPTKTLGLDNYVSDNYEDYENVKCTAKARYSEEDEAVCWIWKDPSTYKI